jgi:hypothetical protein
MEDEIPCAISGLLVETLLKLTRRLEKVIIGSMCSQGSTLGLAV